MDNFENIKKTALRLLSFRPRSEQELRGRLRLKSFSDEDVNKVILYLQKEKMLDDEKFAKLLALSSIQSGGFGKNHVRRELTKKGLAPAQISSAMKEIEGIDELQCARELAQKHFSRMRGLTAIAQRRRLHGVLFRRGFTNEVVFKALDQVLKGRAPGEFNEGF